MAARLSRFIWLLAFLAPGALGGQAAPPGGFAPSLFGDLRFRLLGPSRGGRVTAVAGVADQPTVFYMGSTGGGIWKTINAGISWSNISDGYFESPSIGAIRVADSDPNVIYVGTGSDAIRSNVITGRGVYKSADAGASWHFVGLRETGHIGAVVVHPSNPNIAYVAAMGLSSAPNNERGVYRTVDGGANWKRVLYISDSTGAVDLELAPDNPDEIYAAMWRGERKPWTIISGAREGGIYKSTDGGDRWVKLTNGLPGGLVGKSDLAVSAADPARVYALIEAPVGEGGVYRSDDRGATWRLMSKQPSLLDRPFYYTNIDADPTNADIVYVNSTGFFGSVDGGATWHQRFAPHGDNHDMWINPKHREIWIQSNDGGANITLDGGTTWSTQLNQPTAELYQIAVDDRFPYYVYAGQQDNTTIAVPSLPPTAWVPDHPSAWWLEIGGCETGPAVPKPGDPAVVYSNCKGQFGRYSERTGQEQAYWIGARDLYGQRPDEMRDRFQRVSPISVSPHDARIVYHASQYLYRTTDEGKSWTRISPDLTANDSVGHVYSGTPITRDITGEEYYSTIYAVQESKLERGTILVGANDGPVHITRNGGGTWTDVTPPDLPRGGRIQNVEWSRHRPGVAYFAAYRTLLGDFQPYAFRTNDYGKSWKRLTTGENGVPKDSPTRVIREDPSRDGLLYLGTEFGLYLSFDDGDHWQPFQQNLPVTPVTDIVVHQKDLVLSTMGRSFWILDDLTPLHQLDAGVASADWHLYQPRDAYRIRYAVPPRYPGDAEYPTPGIPIDYYLATEPAGEVALDILDQKGTVIRSFSSEGPGEASRVPEQPGMRRLVLERLGTPRLPKAAGQHRFRWDFALPGPWDANPGRAGRSGPWVTPGIYQARLTVGSRIETRIFHILMDPRVAADRVSPNDLAEQLRTSLAARDLLGEVRRLTADVLEARKKASLTQRDEADRRLAVVQASLLAAGDRYPTPKLSEQAAYLYNMTTIADQRPGRDVIERLVELRSMLAQAKAAFEAIK